MSSSWNARWRQARIPLRLHAAMVGVLTSKNFYYLEEGSAHERRDKVSDWELASRLSYFLWGIDARRRRCSRRPGGHAA